jgi:ArsR family transcriptional regulator
MKSKIICRQLQSLAQETRLTIFRKLIGTGDKGICAGDLCKELNISCSALSFHLNHLSNAGLITSRRDGRFIFYHCNCKAAKELTNFLTRNCCR